MQKARDLKQNKQYLQIQAMISKTYPSIRSQ